MTRQMKSPNHQIVFNPAAHHSSLAGDPSDAPEGVPISTGKKVVRKVKKGSSSGIGASNQMNTIGYNSGNVTSTAARGSNKISNAFGSTSMA